MVEWNEFKQMSGSDQKAKVLYEQYRTRAFLNDLIAEVMDFLHSDAAKAIGKKALADVVKATHNLN